MANDSIYQHLAQDSEPPITTHVFGAIMRLWFLDDITNVQARTLINTSIQQDEEWSTYVLDAAQETQLADIRTIFDALGAADQGRYFNKLESISLLLEDGLISEAEAKSVLGVT